MSSSHRGVCEDSGFLGRETDRSWPSHCLLCSLRMSGNTPTADIASHLRRPNITSAPLIPPQLLFMIHFNTTIPSMPWTQKAHFPHGPWTKLSYAISFDVHRAVRCNIISIVKATRCTNVSNLFYFGMTLNVFRTVFPSIIRSLRLYIQQQAYVKQILLTASKQTAVWERGKASRSAK